MEDNVGNHRGRAKGETGRLEQLDGIWEQKKKIKWEESAKQKVGERE